MNFYLNNINFKNLCLIIVSIYISLVLIETLFILTDLDRKNIRSDISKIIQNKKNNKIFDNRNLMTFYLDYKSKNKNAELSTTSTGFNTHLDASFKLDNGLEVLPLSGISNSITVLCNENGYFATYRSDKYGFNNTSDWKLRYNYLLLGDSIVEGHCVNEKDNIAGNLKKILQNDDVLNLGRGGNGPLKNFAILKEYIDLLNVKDIIYFHTSGNDIQDLYSELNNEILSKYIKDKNFKQELPKLQFLIDEQMRLKLNNMVIRYSKFTEDKDTNIKKNNLIKFLKLNRTIRYKNKILRQITNRKEEKKETDNFSTKYIFGDFIENEFKNIIGLIYDLASEKNINFHFVYVPSYYLDPKTLNKSEKIVILNDQYYNDIVNVISDLGIPLIDLRKILFEKNNDPLSLLPFRIYGHFNEKGNELIANILLKELLSR